MKLRFFGGAAIAAVAVVCGLAHPAARAQEKRRITHTALLQKVLPGSGDQEVTVWDTRYAPGAKNPRHLHRAAVSFFVLSGTGIWQEEGKAPVTLHAGDSLLAPAGTVHSHWNPSGTEALRFLEFIVAPTGQGRSVPRPDSGGR